MKEPISYDASSYSYHTLQIENLSLAITIGNGVFPKTVKPTPLHNHPVFELHAILDGELFLDIQGGERIHLRSGDICLLAPNVYHGVLPVKETERITLCFQIQRLSEGEELHALFAKLITAAHISATEPLISLLKEIQCEMLSKKAASLSLCRAYFSEFFILLCRYLGAHNTAFSLQRMQTSDDALSRYNKIEFLMQQAVAHNLREEDLAQAIGLSVRQTSRVVQKIFGMSFGKKLLELRLHFAKGLLVTTEDSVDKIAEAVGYTSPSGFHIAFKKAFGLTPSEYRQANMRFFLNNRT